MNDESSLQDRLWHEHEGREAYRLALELGCQYLDSLVEGRVYPSREALTRLDAFDEPMPEHPAPAKEILAQLHDLGSPAATNQAGGRYFGFVNGGLLPAALGARLLADFWDQNAALEVMSPVAAKLEAVCESWLVDLFALPAGTAAGLLSGTSSATLCALLAGRNALLRRLGWDLHARGLFGAPSLRVVASQAAHASALKALAVIGFGKEQLTIAPADDQGRFDIGGLPELDESTLLILQAGNVNSGAFDPFRELSETARRAGAWTHIDGAFGLWARACQATAHLTEGMELADSWSVDAHKTLNSPYDCGIVLCRDRGALVSALTASGAYIQSGGGRDGMAYSLDMSRRARSIELWAALKSLGRSGIDQLVAQLCRRARQFAEELQAQGFRILNDVVFNQVLAACEQPALTLPTLAHLQNSGECWCGTSQWHGEDVIRISVCSWTTTEEDIHRSVAAFVAARQKAKSQVQRPSVGARR